MTYINLLKVDVLTRTPFFFAIRSPTQQEREKKGGSEDI
jgi:hypothetical protein